MLIKILLLLAFTVAAGLLFYSAAGLYGISGILSILPLVLIYAFMLGSSLGRM